MVGVLYGFEIKEQGLESIHAQGGSGEDGALKTVGSPVLKNKPRRPRGVRVVVGHVFEEVLDAVGSA
jgi:hypothetical protein